MTRLRLASALASVTAMASLAACTGDAEVPPSPTSTPTRIMSTPNQPTPSPTPTPEPTTAQRQLDDQLREAAWADDVPRARTLIEQGADVDAKDATEQSAYLIATSEGYLELLRLTLANGADIDAKDSWNGTGLIRAAERGHYLVVGELLQAGIDRDHVNRIGYQAIHEAVWLGADTDSYAATVRVLVAGGVELDRPSANEELTPLQMAGQRDFGTLEKILDTATTTSTVSRPDAALLRAAADGDADGVALALRAGADIEARDDNERTALLLAVTEDHADVARVLVALGASPDAIDDRQDTPWLVTGVTGSVEMLETLLPAHPDMTIRNRFGGISVIPASERGHVDYVRRVVDTRIDVNHVNDLGWTALLEAVILGDGGPDHQEIVRILLDAGADPSIADKDGVTALEHAQRRGYTEIAALLGA